MSSLTFALFLKTIFFEYPIDVIEKLSLFEKVVSPPHKKIPYFFCSCFNEFDIFYKFFFENVFLFPLPDTK